MIEGFSDKQFDKVKETFTKLFEKDLEIGASVAIAYKGELILHLWSGNSVDDPKSTTKWSENTLVNCYSITKAITNICLMKMVQDGDLRYEDKVSKYWPEFGAEGKEDIKIFELISHQAGLSSFDEGPVSIFFFADPKSSDFLAKQKPKWNFKSGQSGYHSHSVGMFVNELIKRADKKKRNIREYFEQEIQPISPKTRFYFGLKESDEDKEKLLARLKMQKFSQAENEDFKREISKKDSLTRNAFSVFKDFHPYKGRRCILPSSLGFSNSADLALLGSNVALKFDVNVLNKAQEVVTDKNLKDLVLLEQSIFTKGGFQVDPKYPKSFFHFGFGGSCFLVIPDLFISFSFTCNNLRERREDLIASFFKCLKLGSSL